MHLKPKANIERTRYPFAAMKVGATLVILKADCDPKRLLWAIRQFAHRNPDYHFLMQEVIRERLRYVKITRLAVEAGMPGVRNELPDFQVGLPKHVRTAYKVTALYPVEGDMRFNSWAKLPLDTMAPGTAIQVLAARMKKQTIRARIARLQLEFPNRVYTLATVDENGRDVHEVGRLK